MLLGFHLKLFLHFSHNCIVFGRFIIVFNRFDIIRLILMKFLSVLKIEAFLCHIICMTHQMKQVSHKRKIIILLTWSYNMSNLKKNNLIQLCSIRINIIDWPYISTPSILLGAFIRIQIYGVYQNRNFRCNILMFSGAVTILIIQVTFDYFLLFVLQNIPYYHEINPNSIY